MRLEIKIDGDLNKLMSAEILAGARAVSSSMREAGVRLKLNWRGQITGAGLGQRLANSIRADVFPKGRPSMNAAMLVYSKAPKIIAANETGPLIRSKDGFWLAIPTPAAGNGRRGGRITPGEWQFRNGILLRFVYLGVGKAMLVADDVRVRKNGAATRRKLGRRKDGHLIQATAVPIFILVPQVKLTKRLNLMAAAEAIQASLPAAIVANWRVTR